MDAAKTVQRNLAERHQCLLLDQLPATLKQAINLTRDLGIQYIWIDALCIVQDSQEEWSAEAGRMMSYYANAYLTIVPALSESSADGFRGKFDGVWPTPFRFSGPWSSGRENDIILCKKKHEDSFPNDRTRWSTRGWTLQEQLNSSRILFIFERRVVVECRSGHWDSLRGVKAHSPYEHLFLRFRFSALDTFNNITNLWQKTTSNYMDRNITQPEDRWYAFLGIAKAFAQVLSFPNFMGLRQSRILEDMCSWDLLCNRDWHATHEPRPTNWRIPSWSWLSANGSIHYSLAEDFCFEESHACLLSRLDTEDHTPWSMALDIRCPLLGPAWFLAVMERFKTPPNLGAMEEAHPGWFSLDHYEVSYLPEAIADVQSSCGDNACIAIMHSNFANVLGDAAVLVMGSGPRYSSKPNLDDKERQKDNIWCFLLVGEVAGSTSTGEKVRSYKRIGTMVIRHDRLQEVGGDVLEDLVLACEEDKKETIRLV